MNGHLLHPCVCHSGRGARPCRTAGTHEKSWWGGKRRRAGRGRRVGGRGGSLPACTEGLFVARILCSRPGAAVRNHHRSGCKQQKCLLSWSRGQKSKIKVWAGLSAPSRLQGRVLPASPSFWGSAGNVCHSLGFPGGSEGKESTCNVGDPGSIPGSGRFAGGGHGNPLQYSCLENPHGQRSLVGCNPWGLKELDTTEQLTVSLTLSL